MGEANNTTMRGVVELGLDVHVTGDLTHIHVLVWFISPFQVGNPMIISAYNQPTSFLVGSTTRGSPSSNMSAGPFSIHSMGLVLYAAVPCRLITSTDPIPLSFQVGDCRLALVDDPMSITYLNCPVEAAQLCSLVEAAPGVPS